MRVVGLRPIDPERYFSSLNVYFARLEAVLGIRVVIAAHPKANYQATRFDGRTIIAGRTPELVRDADLVISHHSTSISYAVLAEKPIVFVYTSDMKVAYDQTIMAYLFELGVVLERSSCRCGRA